MEKEKDEIEEMIGKAGSMTDSDKNEALFALYATDKGVGCYIAGSQTSLLALLVANMEKQPAIKKLIEQSLFFHNAAEMGLMDFGKKKENEE